MKDTLWRCKDGRVLTVSQMETRHIIHCINKINRDNWRKKYLARLEIELEIRKLRRTWNY